MKHDIRGKDGRYIDGPKCEHCGKATGYDYYSTSTGGVKGEGYGLVLHEKCVKPFLRSHPEVAKLEAEALAKVGGKPYWCD